MKTIQEISTIIVLLFIAAFGVITAQTEEQKKFVESYRTKAEAIDKKIQKIQAIEKQYTTGEFTGYSMTWNEKNRPIRIFLSLENSEKSELQFFDFENNQLTFVFLTKGDEEKGWQFFFKNSKLEIIIDENKNLVSKDNSVIYKHFEKYLIDRAKKIYQENIGR